MPRKKNNANRGLKGWDYLLKGGQVPDFFYSQRKDWIRSKETTRKISKKKVGGKKKGKISQSQIKAP